MKIYDLIDPKEILARLEKLPDYRRVEEKVEHNQIYILFGVLCAMFVGNIDMTEQHNWIKNNYNTIGFNRLIGEENNHLKIPSYPTVRRVIINIDSTIFEEIFREHFRSKVEINEETQLAVDGKTMNGSGRNGQYDVKRNDGMFNVMETKARIIIAHQEIGHKKSEIPAFYEIVGHHFSEVAFLYTFDALNTQKEGLDMIEEAKKRYLAKVKGNQKKLLKQITETFENESKKEINNIVFFKDKDESIEGGKWVKRETYVLSSKDCDLVIFNSSFQHIRSIIKQVKFITDKNGKEKIKVQYLIANYKDNARKFQETIKIHWVCETYHYYKDMLTKEDACKVSVNPFGLSILRSFVINHIQLYFNANKDENKKLKMKTIFKDCVNSPDFLGNFENSA